MCVPQWTPFSWFGHGKANHCHKFTKLKFEDTKCNMVKILDLNPFVVLTTGNLGRCYGSYKQLKFKSHKRMQVEFISNNIDVMTHHFLSSVYLIPAEIYRYLATITWHCGPAQALYRVRCQWPPLCQIIRAVCKHC